MGAIADALTGLDTERKAIAAAVNAKGVAATDTDTLKALAVKIGQIQTGGQAATTTIFDTASAATYTDKMVISNWTSSATQPLDMTSAKYTTATPYVNTFAYAAAHFTDFSAIDDNSFINVGAVNGSYDTSTCIVYTEPVKLDASASIKILYTCDNTISENVDFFFTQSLSAIDTSTVTFSVIPYSTYSTPLACLLDSNYTGAEITGYIGFKMKMSYPTMVIKKIQLGYF